MFAEKDNNGRDYEEDKREVSAEVFGMGHELRKRISDISDLISAGPATTKIGRLLFLPRLHLPVFAIQGELRIITRYLRYALSLRVRHRRRGQDDCGPIRTSFVSATSTRPLGKSRPLTDFQE